MKLYESHLTLLLKLTVFGVLISSPLRSHSQPVDPTQDPRTWIKCDFPGGANTAGGYIYDEIEEDPEVFLFGFKAKAIFYNEATYPYYHYVMWAVFSSSERRIWIYDLLEHSLLGFADPAQISDAEIRQDYNGRYSLFINRDSGYFEMVRRTHDDNGNTHLTRIAGFCKKTAPLSVGEKQF